LFPENSYGMVKRLLFLEEAIRSMAPKEVLDVGCGNGFYLTTPLATKFSGVQFFGIDTDRRSIEHARSENALINLEFSFLEETLEGKEFDLILASEVIEHVDDPLKFLGSLKKRLKPGGKIFLSMPNGYGPFEITCFLEATLNLFFIRPLRRGKQALRSLIRREMKEQGISKGDGIVRDTLAMSPHINFFSYKSICKLIEGAGLGIVDFTPRTFLCGYLFDQIFRSERWILWNARVVDQLPKCFASDWMFMLEVKSRPEEGRFRYRSSALGRVRRWISCQRLLDETPHEFR